MEVITWSLMYTKWYLTIRPWMSNIEWKIKYKSLILLFTLYGYVGWRYLTLIYLLMFILMKCWGLNNPSMLGENSLSHMYESGSSIWKTPLHMVSPLIVHPFARKRWIYSHLQKVLHRYFPNWPTLSFHFDRTWEFKASTLI